MHGYQVQKHAVITVFIACFIILAGHIGMAAAAQMSLGDRSLSIGAWGADVFELQQQLIRIGYDIPADGHFGKGTQRAVMAFQIANGLKPDGIVGPTTLSALEAVRPTVTYVVQVGDSLWKIAQRFETTMEELVVLNDLSGGPLKVGQKLQVPTTPTYKVRPGDTLSEIARRFATTVAEIVRLNEIKNPNNVRSGRVLKLPQGATPTVPGF